MYYVYVIQNLESKAIYIGYTNNLKRRLFEHNNNKSFSTKNRGAWKLIYYEASLHEEDAKAREKYLKSGMGKKYLKNRLKRSLSLTG